MSSASRRWPWPAPSTGSAMTDLEKCGFVEDTLVAGSILDPSVAGTLAQQIRERSTGLTVNSYSEPYYWAGFSFSGR